MAWEVNKRLLVTVELVLLLTLSYCQSSDEERKANTQSLVDLLGSFDISKVQEADNNPATPSPSQPQSNNAACSGQEKVPEGGITCAERKEWGSCYKEWMIEGDYCAITCNRCQAQDEAAVLGSVAPEQNAVDNCVDIPVEGDKFGCWDRKKWGACNLDWMIDGGYCAKTCGRCGQEDNSPRPAPKPQQSGNRVEQSSAQAGGQSSGNFKLRIIAFGDFHGRVEPQTEWWKDCDWNQDQNGACFGGIPRMKAIIDQERAKQDMPTLVLNAGDDFVGTAWDYNWKWDGSKAMANFLNRLGVDVMTLGNHEFDRGPDELLKYLNELDYPAISCNTNADKHSGLKNKIQGGIIKDFNGVKVGIVGFTVESTADYSNPYPVYFTNKDEAGKRCINQLKQQGANIIIVLNHIGFGGDKRIAQTMDDVDLVIGGHSHILLHYGDAPRLNKESGSRDEKISSFPAWVWSTTQQKDVPAMQCAHFSRYMCIMEAEFDSQGNLINLQGNTILLGGYQSDNNVQGDADVWNEVISWKYW
eukprot:TRINITY_DN155_c5_g1_i1.p1 TRINITY_DN155_c5_g1~~TRINITY_DN155_c5_g1_i1.p1  ORF type:complete len:529 (-),score=58.47 TRINITY_DN155_c5_g1_i1:76-1662(-)